MQGSTSPMGKGLSRADEDVTKERIRDTLLGEGRVMEGLNKYLEYFWSFHETAPVRGVNHL
jgi:hypothetical protein